jgi:hypothetical protein
MACSDSGGQSASKLAHQAQEDRRRVVHALPNGFQDIQLGMDRISVIERVKARHQEEQLDQSEKYLSERVKETDGYPFDRLTYRFYDNRLYKISYHYRAPWDREVGAEFKKKFGSPDREWKEVESGRYWEAGRPFEEQREISISAWTEQGRELRLEYIGTWPSIERVMRREGFVPTPAIEGHLVDLAAESRKNVEDKHAREEAAQKEKDREEQERKQALDKLF